MIGCIREYIYVCYAVGAWLVVPSPPHTPWWGEEHHQMDHHHGVCVGGGGAIETQDIYIHIYIYTHAGDIRVHM